MLASNLTEPNPVALHSVVQNFELVKTLRLHFCENARYPVTPATRGAGFLFPGPEQKSTAGGQASGTGKGPTHETAVRMLATQVYTNPLDNDIPTSAGPHAGLDASQGLSSFDISPQATTTGNPPLIEADAGDWFGVLEVAEHGRYARFIRDGIYVDADGNAWERGQLGIDAEQWRERQRRVGSVAAAGDAGNREFAVGLDADGNVTGISATMVAKRCKRGGARRNTAKRKTGFGKSSRRRLLTEFSKMDTRADMLFCTLTMPDELPSDDWKQWKRWLDNFIKRLLRRYPLVSGAWRIEMKHRKSGSMAGELAPHFHLIIYRMWASNAERKTKPAVLADFREWASAAWNQVVGGDAAHLKAGVQSDWIAGKKAVGYVSRYVGKVPADADGELPDIGRHWGWFNRAELPYSGMVKFVIHTWSQGRLLGLMRAIAGIPEDKRWKLPSIRAFKPMYEMLLLLFERDVWIVSGNVDATGQYAPAG